MSVYRRPPRPDELYHWGKGSVAGNHKYIAKIGNRYFYTPEELKAFKQGVSGVGQRVSDNFSKLRQRAYDAAGGAAKRKAQASAQRANVLKNNMAKTHERSQYDRLGLDQAKELKRAQDATMSPKSEAGHVARLENSYAKKAAEDYGHSDNSHNTGHVDVVYKKSKVPASTTERGRIQANTNRIIKEYEKDAENSNKQDWATYKAAENAQKVADKDAAAYRKTLLGRAEAAGKKINRAKKETAKAVSNVVKSDTAKRVGNAVASSAYRPASGVKSLYDSARGFATGYKYGKEYVEKNGIDAAKKRGVEKVDQILKRKKKKR